MRQRRAAGFSISVFGRFAYILSALNVHYLEEFFKLLCILVMFVQRRQPVREQPDTKYWKSPRPGFAPAWMKGYGSVSRTSMCTVSHTSVMISKGVSSLQAATICVQYSSLARNSSSSIRSLVAVSSYSDTL